MSSGAWNRWLLCQKFPIIPHHISSLITLPLHWVEGWPTTSGSPHRQKFSLGKALLHSWEWKSIAFPTGVSQLQQIDRRRFLFPSTKIDRVSLPTIENCVRVNFKPQKSLKSECPTTETARGHVKRPWVEPSYHSRNPHLFHRFIPPPPFFGHLGVSQLQLKNNCENTNSQLNN